MTHTYTWRCTACPRPRTTVETTEDTPPVCPTCGKVMKTHDCCGMSGAQKNTQRDPRCGCGDCTRQKSNPEPMPVGEYEVEQFSTVEGRPVSLGRKIGVPFEQTLDAAFGRSGVYPAEHMPNYSNPFESPDAEFTKPLELGRHVYYRPMGVAVQEQLNMPAEIVDSIPGTYEYHHPDAVHFIKGPEPDDPTVPVFNTTNLERRLDVTEHLVCELTERLYPVVQGDVETEVGGDCSPLGERVERINGSLGRLLGGLDLP